MNSKVMRTSVGRSAADGRVAARRLGDASQEVPGCPYKDAGAGEVGQVSVSGDERIDACGERQATR
jgi:hypothetical protein